MENLGALSLLLAFAITLYTIAGSLIGRWKANQYLIVSAERGVYAVFALVTIASGLLIHGLITGAYHLTYVSNNSNQSMPIYYRFAAWWGGQEGSLLLWAWLLGAYATIAIWTNRNKYRDIMPYVTSILMVTMAFFLLLITFVLSPFDVWALGKGVFTPPDGRGLNPLLQYWTMIIHPPMLYLGYVGFVVPFAFAISSLIVKQPGDAWINTTRRWTLVTWFFQTSGILLGAGWAYAALGWGGYWVWDPVENASFLPWLTATAFLHSVMMQEKKGMMKVWNMVLVAATFFLCIFGTFLTRSGLVSSVHAFAQSPIGNYFVVFLSVGIAATTWLILSRLDFLKSESRIESVLSRESTFLFNNLILLASCFAVLWGTLFPVISEALTGEKISVDKPWYDRINIPIGLFLMLLTGIGPLIAWRRTSWDSLRKAFAWPTIGAVGLIAALVAFGIRHPYALISFGLCMFVAWTIVAEFFKGAGALRTKNNLNWISAMWELTHRNTRRYGGYIVHMGIVIMFVGFTGSAFNLDKTVEVPIGGTLEIGRYTLKVGQLDQGRNNNYSWGKLPLEVIAGGQSLGTIFPEKRFYFASEQPASEVAIRRRLNEDLYVNFAGSSNDQNSNKVVVQAYVFPLVSWIWVGYWATVFGTLICLIPSKVQRVYLKTEIVGVIPATHARAQS